MVGAPKADKLEFFRHRLGETERGLDGFGATGIELQMRDAFGQQLAYQIDEGRAGLGSEAAEASAGELLVETLDIVRMTMPDAANRHAGNEIQIFVSIRVDNGAAAGPVYGDS